MRVGAGIQVAPGEMMSRNSLKSSGLVKSTKQEAAVVELSERASLYITRTHARTHTHTHTNHHHHLVTAHLAKLLLVHWPLQLKGENESRAFF